MQRAEIADRVRGEIERLAAAPVGSDNQELFKTGFLDSINVLNIIAFIESEFDVKLDAFDLNLDMLGSVAKIADFVVGKLDG